ncbi:MAG: pentapeptide repeat-containing protein [Pseudomonadota bacterium]|nr:pentapeptide repeat-containing protein [Pseudomonadota bacterium]
MDQVTIEACLRHPSFMPSSVNFAHAQISESALIDFLTHRGGNIRFLDLSYVTSVTNALFAIIAKYCGKLETLLLRHTKVYALNTPLKIRKIDLSGTAVNDAIIAQLSLCSNLSTLILCNTAVTHFDFPLNIENLDISGCNVNESIFPALQKNFPHLRSLRLSTAQLTRLDLNAVNFLISLDVSGCTKLQRIAAQSAASMLKLQELHANNCPQLESIVIDEARSLVVLIANNTGVIEVSLSSDRSLPALRVLHLDHNTQLKTVKANPTDIIAFSAINSHNIESRLNDALCRCLLAAVVATNGAAPSLIGTSSMTLLLRVKAYVVEWAEREFGAEVFKGINVPNVDATFANLAGADFYGANFKDGIFTGANMSDTKCISVNFLGARFDQLPLLYDHHSTIQSLCHHKESGLFASTDRSGILVLRHHQKIRHTFALNHPIVSAIFCPNEQKIIVAGSSDIYTYDINPSNKKPYQQLSCVSKYAENISAIAYTPDGKDILIASYDGKIRILNSKRVLDSKNGAVHTLSINPKNGILAAGYENGRIMMWNLKTNSNNALKVVDAHEGPIKKMHFTPDGNYLISCGATDKCVKIWGVRASYQCERKLTTEDKLVTCLAISPDNHFIFASTEKALYIWSIKTGELLRKFGVESPIHCIDVDPTPPEQNAWLVRTACEDNHIRGFIYRDNGQRYQLKRFDFATIFKAKGMEIDGSSNLTDANIQFLRDHQATGQPKSSMLLTSAYHEEDDKEHTSSFHVNAL